MKIKKELKEKIKENSEMEKEVEEIKLNIEKASTAEEIIKCDLDVMRGNSRGNILEWFTREWMAVLGSGQVEGRTHECEGYTGNL